MFSIFSANIPDDEIGQTYNCFMGQTDGCNEFLAVWSVGIDGYCFHNMAGLRMGLKGYTRAILEVDEMYRALAASKTSYEATKFQTVQNRKHIGLINLKFV